MSPRSLRAASVSVAVGWLISGAVAAGGQRRPGSVQTSYIVSPVVVATVMATRAADGAETLDLLVLWRGSPGWFFRDGGTGSSGGGTGTWVYATARYGDLQLQLSLDTAARIAIVQGTRVELKDANIVLVDGADTRAVVVGMLRADPLLADAPRIEPVLRSSARLLEFLRCDVRLDDPGRDAAVQRMCAMVLGK
jgi:hypothetical protein